MYNNTQLQGFTNNILNMDCLDFMRECPDNYFDLILTDPPYGIGRFGDRVGKKANEWDFKPTQEYWDEIFRISKNQIIWGANNFILPESEYFLIWNKHQTVDNFASAELAYTNMKIPAKVFDYSIHKVMAERKSEGGKEHPTQKPVKLFEWCLQLSEKFISDNPIILDCFSGSGTTAIAAFNKKMDFICIEKDKDYYKASVERLNNAKAQMRLF